MRTATCLALLTAAAVLLVPAIGHAHPRQYLASDQFITLGQVVGARTCVDETFRPLGVGGVVGGLTQTVGATLDPAAPDSGGSCYRPNHVVPNLNGDVTFGAMDGGQSNVGVCVSQDRDGDDTFCNDPADVQKRGCNQVTVNVNTNPENGAFLPDAWIFQTQAGHPPARITWVTVPVLAGLAALGPIQPDCGVGVDSFGTMGVVHHS